MFRNVLEVNVFENNIVSSVTAVCICWLILWSVIDANVIKLIRKPGRQKQQHNNSNNNNMTLMGAISAWGEPLQPFGNLVFTERGTI